MRKEMIEGMGLLIVGISVFMLIIFPINSTISGAVIGSGESIFNFSFIIFFIVIIFGLFLIVNVERKDYKMEKSGVDMAPQRRLDRGWRFLGREYGQDRTRDSNNDFYLVKHSYLNSNSYDFDKLMEEVRRVQGYVPGRKVIPVLEGDVTSVKETGEIVLTHKNFARPSQETYQTLKGRGIAASLEEVLERAEEFKRRNPNAGLVLCFEPKVVTDRDTLVKTIEMLKKRGYGSRDVYFDSFYGNKLDIVSEENQRQGTDYSTSLHVAGNIGDFKFEVPIGRTSDYSVVTVPKKLSFGTLGGPVIYGAVGSVEDLAEIAKNPNYLGAYLREKEGKGIMGGLKMLWNSISNTRRFRWNGS